jgi:hypothetical protein
MSLKYRTFTKQFKNEIAEQILYRSIPVGQLSREHNKRIVIQTHTVTLIISRLLGSITTDQLFKLQAAGYD